MDDSKRTNAPTPSATTVPDSICTAHSVCSPSFTDCTATGTSRETASGSRSHSGSSSVTGAESGPKPPSGRELNSPSRCGGERRGGSKISTFIGVSPAVPRRGPMKLAVEVIGWAGALLILGAYAVLSAGRPRAKFLAHHLLKILGGLGVLGNSRWEGG